MDQRLEEASHTGDLEALHRLLQEDRILLDQLSTTTPSAANNPLHIAALLGHANFVREVHRLNPSLARDTNANGLTPLHLASARGHLAVVRELLSAADGIELCHICDRDGRMPIHTAAAKGRMEVLQTFIETLPEWAGELTCREENVVHCAVNSGSYEAVRLLLERLEGTEVSLLNSKDDNGNTILHLAVARRQLKIVKLLLTKPEILVNEVNARGFTALDLLIESPQEYGDLSLAEIIRASGGRKGSEGRPQQPAQASPVHAEGPAVTRPETRFNKMIRYLIRAMIWLGLTPTPIHPNSKQTNTQQTLVVVATLIATITFQPILSPPGGFDTKTGIAARGKDLQKFLVFDLVGLFASLTIILLFVCVEPRRKRNLTKILVWVMWLAVYSTALAFATAALVIFPNSSAVSFLVNGWYVILEIVILWVYHRFCIYLFSITGWWNTKPREGTGNSPGTRVSLAIKRSLVLVMVVVFPYAGLAFLIFFPLQSTKPDWSCYLTRPWVGILEFPQVYLALRAAIHLWKKAGWIKNGESDSRQNGLIKRTMIGLSAFLFFPVVGYQVYYLVYVIWIPEDAFLLYFYC